MPVTNTRRHSVMAEGEQPSREAIVSVFETINDVVPVANEADRTVALNDIGASTARPLIVWRADAAPGRQLEVTTDGTTWRVIAQEDDTGWVVCSRGTGWGVVVGDAVEARRLNGVVYIRGALERLSTATLTLFHLPSGMRPAYNHWLGPHITNTSVSYELRVGATGAVIFVGGYATGAAATGAIHPVSGSFAL